MRSKTLGLCALLWLSGCLSLERQGGEGFLMDLPSIPAAARERPAHGMLSVYLPTASATLDTRRVALLRPDGAADYYEGARWPDFLPVMVRDAVTQTLAHRQLAAQVVTDDVRASGPYRLQIVIESFQAEYRQLGQAPMVRIQLQATLEDTRRPARPRSFTIIARQQAAADRLPSIQAAFRSAFETAQRDLMTQLSTVVK